MAKTDFEWQGETSYISDVTDKGGIVSEMNNDKATFIRYCVMQKAAAEKDGFHGAVTTIQHCIDDLTGDADAAHLQGDQVNELIKASRYYRNRALGWVFLRNGQPYHYTGRTAKRDALSALRSVYKDAQP